MTQRKKLCGEPVRDALWAIGLRVPKSRRIVPEDFSDEERFRMFKAVLHGQVFPAAEITGWDGRTTYVDEHSVWAWRHGGRQRFEERVRASIAAWWLGAARWRPLAGVFAAAALGCLAWWQTGFWRDEPTLWQRTLAVDGERNSIANVCLGQYHFEFGHDVKESVRYFDRAFAVSPDFALEFGLAYMNALCEAGEEEKACALYKSFQTWNDVRMEAEGKQMGGKVWGADLASAHIALLLTDKTALPLAQEELDRLAKVHPRSQHTLYLKGRIAEVRGDGRGARAAWRETVDAAVRDGVFVKYRFLRDRLERRTEDGVE